MSRSIRCSDEVYRKVTAVAGEKGLSLTDALDYVTGTQPERVTTDQPADQGGTEAVSGSQLPTHIIFTNDVVTPKDSPVDPKDDRPPDQFVITPD